jgi:hypothetical protein
MSETLRNWAIITVCLHAIAGFWMAADPNTLGQWGAMRDVAYDSVWSKYTFECIQSIK